MGATAWSGKDERAKWPLLLHEMLAVRVESFSPANRMIDSVYIQCAADLGKSMRFRKPLTMAPTRCGAQ